MPIEIRLVDNGRGLEYLVKGAVTGAEIIEANNRFYTPDVLENLNYKLVDRTDCETYHVSSDDVRTIADQDIAASKINPDIVIVIVAKTTAQLGMTRMWQIISEETGFDVRIFKERKSADEFIDKTFG